MSQAEGPLPAKMEKSLLIAGGIALGLLLICAVCAVVLIVLALLGPTISTVNSSIIIDI